VTFSSASGTGHTILDHRRLRSSMAGNSLCMCQMPRACAAAAQVPAAPFGDPVIVESGVPKYPATEGRRNECADRSPSIGDTHTMVQKNRLQLGVIYITRYLIERGEATSTDVNDLALIVRPQNAYVCIESRRSGEYNRLSAAETVRPKRRVLLWGARFIIDACRSTGDTSRSSEATSSSAENILALN
jgi:hypothetical protein